MTARPPGGLFDLQVNGFAGCDFQDQTPTLAEMLRVVHALQAHGTTRILVTLITDDVATLERKVAGFERLCGGNAEIAAMIAGYHLEGPYLSPRDGFRGAHEARWMKAPDCAEFDRLWRAAAGRLRLITLAPEWPGSAGFIRHARSHGVRLAIGHSDANEKEIEQAIEAGLGLCTHLGNGVPATLPRHDNIIQRLLARDELYAAFIPDGIHLPAAVLKNFVRAKPQDRVLFTTDCMAAAGAPPGEYALGRLRLRVGDDGMVREPGRENFAGSSLTMDRAHANVSKILGWSEAEILAACGLRIAQFLGLRS